MSDRDATRRDGRGEARLTAREIVLAGAVVHMRGRRPAVPQARTWARTRGDSDCRSASGMAGETLSSPRCRSHEKCSVIGAETRLQVARAAAP